MKHSMKGGIQTPLVPLAFAPVGTTSMRASDERAAFCRDDVMRLCMFAIPDHDRIVGCLKSQRANLSPSRRAVFNEGSSRSDGRRSASPR